VDLGNLGGIVEAKQAIPHFYLTADVGTDALIRLREEANAAAPRTRDGAPAFRLSLNDIIVKAWAAALQRVPAANAVWAGDRILRLSHADIGVAVAVDGGLFTPIVRQAETKTLSAISAEIRELSARDRACRLKPQEYQGGSSVASASASSPPSSTRRKPRCWRWAPPAARRWSVPTAVSASSAR
jgi:pyruvate dehydrogenase E2 component (dihydrolipoamide acetyltransferase)